MVGSINRSTSGHIMYQHVDRVKRGGPVVGTIGTIVIEYAAMNVVKALSSKIVGHGDDVPAKGRAWLGFVYLSIGNIAHLKINRLTWDSVKRLDKDKTFLTSVVEHLDESDESSTVTETAEKPPRTYAQALSSTSHSNSSKSDGHVNASLKVKRKQ